MEYFKVGLRDLEIERITIDKVTAHHIHINGTEIPKEGVDCYYYPSFDEAKKALISFYDGMACGLEIRLIFAKDKLEKAKAL
jgi:hypothetical protein